MGPAKKDKDEERIGFFAFFSGKTWYGRISLVLVAAFLALGGGAAWFTMKEAARTLAGGADSTRLAPIGAYNGSAGGVEKDDGFFASEEELGSADPSLKKDILDSSADAAVPSAGDVKQGVDAGSVAQETGSSGVGAAAAPAAGSNFSPAAKISAGEGAFPLSKNAQTPGPAAARSQEVLGGSSARGAPPGGGKLAGGVAGARKTSVMESLKSAFNTTFYGARLASRDTARMWIARAFDATEDPSRSLKYDEKAKVALDRIDPNSIPGFLREQDLGAAGARSLAASEVGRPDFDEEGTRAALRLDKDYQAKKETAELAKALFTPLGPFGGSIGNSGGQPDYKGFSDPGAVRTLHDIGLEDWVATNGYGAECGCTAQSPCCCMPQEYFNGQGCPAYGPFQPGDPCGTGFSGGSEGVTGDFPEQAWS
jgi:hypothetical protein